MQAAVPNCQTPNIPLGLLLLPYWLIIKLLITRAHKWGSRLGEVDMEDYKFLEENKVDFLDLLACLILRRKAILCFAFIGCVLLGLVFLIKTEIKTVENAGASPKKIAASSASLSEAEALEVRHDDGVGIVGGR